MMDKKIRKEANRNGLEINDLDHAIAFIENDEQGDPLLANEHRQLITLETPELWKTAYKIYKFYHEYAH